MGIAEVIKNCIYSDQELPEELVIKKMCSDFPLSLCRGVDTLYVVLSDSWSEIMIKELNDPRVVIRYKNNIYIKGHIISTEDLEDTGIMFNLSLMLSTNDYKKETILEAKEICKFTEDSFVLFCDNLKEYTERY